MRGRWRVRATLVSLLSLGLSAALVSSAAAANLNYSADTTLTLSSPPISLTIVTGSAASSLVLNDGNVVVGVDAGDTFNLTSASRGITVSGTVAGVTTSTSCSAALVATVTIASSTGSGTFTLTPTATPCTPPAATSTGGGGGGGGGYSPPPDTTPPTNTSVVIAGGAVTTATANVTLTLAATDAIQMMVSNDAAFTSVNWETYITVKSWALSSGDGVKTVYVKFRDTAGNISAAVSDDITVASAATPPPAVETPPAATPPVTPPLLELPTSPAPSVVPTPSVIADASQLAQELGVQRSESAEQANGTKVAASVQEFKLALDETSKTVATNFVTYGISPATQKLGSGERLALVRDQLETLGRVSVAALEQLASGQKPVDRNLPKEQAQVSRVLRYFQLLTGHRPDFKNAMEDLAWNTMMYRVRFNRDLAKERLGITKFRSTFARIPKTPLEWATVRAYGYALK